MGVRDKEGRFGIRENFVINKVWGLGMCNFFGLSLFILDIVVIVFFF